MMVMMMLPLLWGYWNGLKALDFVAFLVGPLFLLAYARWDLITTSLICFVIAYLNTCLLALAQRVQKHLLQIFSFSFLSEPVNIERSMQLFYGNSWDSNCYWICGWAGNNVAKICLEEELLCVDHHHHQVFSSSIIVVGILFWFPFTTSADLLALSLPLPSFDFPFRRKVLF